MFFDEKPLGMYEKGVTRECDMEKIESRGNGSGEGGGRDGIRRSEIIRRMMENITWNGMM